MNAVMKQHVAEIVREDGESYISPKKVGELLGPQIQAIAKNAHVHRNTPTAYPESDELQEYLRNVVRVMIVLEEVTQGDIKKAAYWFKNVPIRELSSKTANELVAARETDAVVTYLEMMMDGPTGSS